MAKSKQYRVLDANGVVGFNGIIHGAGDVVSTDNAPVANIKAWLRFGQVEEVKAEEPKSEDGGQKSEGGKKEAKK